MGWMNEWAGAATAVKARLDAQPQFHRCGTRMVLGFNNLGVGVAVCPKCSPELVDRPCGDVWDVP